MEATRQYNSARTRGGAAPCPRPFPESWRHGVVASWRRPRRGAILYVTLIIVLMAGLLAAGLTFYIRSQLAGESAGRMSAQAAEAASAGVARAMALLLDPQQPFECWFRAMAQPRIPERIVQYYGQLAWNELRDEVALRRFIRKTAPEALQQLEQRIARFSDTA